MKEKHEFELVGYDRPLGRYPSPARPIVKNPVYTGDSDRYLAVYLEDRSQMSSEPIDASFEFIELPPTQKQKLVETFDCRQHELFAVSESDLRFYKPQDRVWFFARLLYDESFSHEDPLFRISLAKEVGDRDLITREFESAERYLLQHDRDLLWYLNDEKSKFHHQEPAVASASVGDRVEQTNTRQFRSKNLALMNAKIGNSRRFYRVIFGTAA